MIFASCIYCDAPYDFPMPEQTPAWAIHTCEKCGKKSIDEASRITPQSFTPEGFSEEYGEKYPDLVKQILEDISK